MTTSTVTLDGMPLYTVAGDSDAGDVAGQGVQDVWCTVSEPAPMPGY